MKIFLNPGHYPCNDSGAVGYGLKECDVAYDIAARVENYLKRNAAQVTTKLVQNELEEVVYSANSWEADLFVSIHCNASQSHNAKGTETFHYYGAAEGKKLATAIHNQIIKTIPELVNRGVKVASHYVTRETDMPACLVETAFIDEPNDNKILRERVDDFSKAIAQGILVYAGLKPDVVDSHITCPFCGNSFDYD